MFYGYVSDYADVQKIQERAGTYDVVKIDGKLECKYSIGFSMTDCNKDKTEVAETLLLSMYSDIAEDIMFMQSAMAVVPINKSTLKTFEKDSEFTDFFENVEEYKLK